MAQPQATAGRGSYDRVRLSGAEAERGSNEEPRRARGVPLGPSRARFRVASFREIRPGVDTMEPKDLGRLGEGAAARYLQARGWRVVGRNVRVGRRELDLIVQRGKILAFVEVKSRVGIGFGDPLEAIGARKRVEVARAAAAWLQSQRHGGWSVIRFDAVGVLWSGPGRMRITHVPDAWRME